MTVELWKTILLSFVAICGGFSTVCVAVGWLMKVWGFVRKPAQSMKAKFEKQDELLDNDNRRIKELEKQFSFMLKALPILLQDDLIILNHLRTDNNTGKMEKQEEKLNEFLLNRD